MNKLTFAAAGLLVFTAVEPVALAQSSEQRPWAERQLAAPSSALELTLSTGYTQPFGMVERGLETTNVATPGIGIDLGVGYRITPRWSISYGAQYFELTAERGSSTRGLAPSIALTYHFAPDVRVDPWLELGSGYRFLWENGAQAGVNTLWHGFRMATARVGIDLRAGSDVSLAPFVGADVNVFMWRDDVTAVAIADPRVNTFFFAGLQGRFDIGGTKVGGAGLTSAPLER